MSGSTDTVTLLGSTFSSDAILLVMTDSISEVLSELTELTDIEEVVTYLLETETQNKNTNSINVN